MPFREESLGADYRDTEQQIADYVRRQQRVRGERAQEEFPVCADCTKRHSGHYDCGK